MSDLPLLRVDEAAEQLGVSGWTIYRWVEEGRLQATKIGRSSLRILPHSVRAMSGVTRHRRIGNRTGAVERVVRSAEASNGPSP